MPRRNRGSRPPCAHRIARQLLWNSASKLLRCPRVCSDFTSSLFGGHWAGNGPPCRPCSPGAKSGPDPPSLPHSAASRRSQPRERDVRVGRTAGLAGRGISASAMLRGSERGPVLAQSMRRIDSSTRSSGPEQARPRAPLRRSTWCSGSRRVTGTLRTAVLAAVPATPRSSTTPSRSRRVRSRLRRMPPCARSLWMARCRQLRDRRVASVDSCGGVLTQTLSSTGYGAPMLVGKARAYTRPARSSSGWASTLFGMGATVCTGIGAAATLGKTPFWRQRRGGILGDRWSMVQCCLSGFQCPRLISPLRMGLSMVAAVA